MQGLDNKIGKINNKMTKLMILNILSFQIIPTTIMGIMVSSCSESTIRIILPTIITSILKSDVMIFATNLFLK